MRMADGKCCFELESRLTRHFSAINLYRELGDTLLHWQKLEKVSKRYDINVTIEAIGISTNVCRVKTFISRSHPLRAKAETSRTDRLNDLCFSFPLLAE
jgi:hypothetical protein